MLNVKWAPSSEFVSSSIPSWQILTAHAQPFRGDRDLAFYLKVPLGSLLVSASSEGSGETARMRRLAWTFAARIGDKYQIRLARPKCAWWQSCYWIFKPIKWFDLIWFDLICTVRGFASFSECCRELITFYYNYNTARASDVTVKVNINLIFIWTESWLLKRYATLFLLQKNFRRHFEHFPSNRCRYFD